MKTHEGCKYFGFLHKFCESSRCQNTEEKLKYLKSKLGYSCPDKQNLILWTATIAAVLKE